MERRGRDAGTASPPVPPRHSNFIPTFSSSPSQFQVRRAPVPGSVRQPGAGDGVERRRDVAPSAPQGGEQQPRPPPQRQRVEEFGESCRGALKRRRRRKGEGVQLCQPGVPPTAGGAVEAGAEPRAGQRQERRGQSRGGRRIREEAAVDDDLPFQRNILRPRRRLPRRGAPGPSPHGPQRGEARGCLCVAEEARAP